MTCTREALRKAQPYLAERRRELERQLLERGDDPHAIDAAALQALVLGQHVRRDAARNDAALVGYIEVLETSPATAALTQRPSADNAVLTEIESSLTSDAELTEAIVGAKHALEWLETIRDAIATGRLDDGLAGALNREAGTHAIARDLREVHAALLAGERSREAWSYYEARYGERGLRFTRSDSAWLVTLWRETPELATQQITWLGRVLAARGMPRFLLECHLEVLHDQLTAFVPERATAYDALRRIVAELANERRTLLSDAESNALAREFVVGDTTADTTVKHHVPPLEAGKLIVAAALDEASGIPGAVQSLCHWLEDPARFPTAWRDAVARTLQATRAALSRSS
jgi:hypothetical protein